MLALVLLLAGLAAVVRVLLVAGSEVFDVRVAGLLVGSAGSGPRNVVLSHGLLMTVGILYGFILA